MSVVNNRAKGFRNHLFHATRHLRYLFKGGQHNTTINTKNIHRSNALLGHRYGEDFVYDEMFLTGPGDKGEEMAIAISKDRSMQDNPPKPGEGPSKEERETGFYDVMFTGETADGQRLTASVKGDKDPGYGSTSKMITECALALVKDVSRDQTPGGVYTDPQLGPSDRILAVDEASAPVWQ